MADEKYMMVVQPDDCMRNLNPNVNLLYTIKCKYTGNASILEILLLWLSNDIISDKFS